MRQRLSLALRSAFMAALAVVLAAPLRADYPQAADTPGPDCYASLSKAKLVEKAAGWAIVNQPASDNLHQHSNGEACTSEHLYWTDNDGQTWREITPDRMPTKNLGMVFFLDRNHGWTVSSDADRDDSKDPFFVLSTEDGGKHWQTFPIQRVAENSMTEFFPAEIFFSDSQHGWILWHWAMMNPSASALTATSDGGRTWKTLPEPPGAGPMQFTSSLGGWMAGAAPGQEKSPFKENNQLWATHDGGEHWSAIPIPVPTASPEGVRFGALKFNDEGDGVVVAEYPVSDYVQEFITCVTHDGGRSWKFSQFDGYEASPSLVGAHVIWTMFHPAVTAGTIFEQRGTPNSIRIDDREFLPSIPEEMSLEGVLNAVEFIDDSNGWTTYINGRPARFGQPRKAFASLELLATTDGGKTFRSITPRAAQEHPIPPPELYLLNGSILRFPPLPPLAVRPPPIPSTDGCQIRFRPSVGGPMILSGTRFRSENTVWLGSHAIPVASNDGKTLKFLVPFDVTPGTYKIFVENTNGKTNDTVVTIRPAQPLRISNIQNGEPLHPGQHIILSGSGFLLENIVWFGAQGVPAKLIISGGLMLVVEVPASIPSGECEIRVSNGSEKSDVVRAVILHAGIR